MNTPTTITPAFTISSEPDPSSPHTVGTRLGRRTRSPLFLAAGIGALLIAGAVFAAAPHHPAAQLPGNPRSAAEWVHNGGGHVVAEVQFRAYALAYVRNDVNVASECSQLAEATEAAARYGPIPDQRAQALWSTTLAVAQNAVKSCSLPVGADPAVVRHPVASYARDVVVDAHRVIQRLSQQGRNADG